MQVWRAMDVQTFASRLFCFVCFFFICLFVFLSYFLYFHFSPFPPSIWILASYLKTLYRNGKWWWKEPKRRLLVGSHTLKSKFWRHLDEMSNNDNNNNWTKKNYKKRSAMIRIYTMKLVAIQSSQQTNKQTNKKKFRQFMYRNIFLFSFFSFAAFVWFGLKTTLIHTKENFEFKINRNKR